MCFFFLFKLLFIRQWFRTIHTFCKTNFEWNERILLSASFLFPSNKLVHKHLRAFKTTACVCLPCTIHITRTVTNSKRIINIQIHTHTDSWMPVNGNECACSQCVLYKFKPNKSYLCRGAIVWSKSVLTLRKHMEKKFARFMAMQEIWLSGKMRNLKSMQIMIDFCS